MKNLARQVPHVSYPRFSGGMTEAPSWSAKSSLRQPGIPACLFISETLGQKTGDPMGVLLNSRCGSSSAALQVLFTVKRTRRGIESIESLEIERVQTSSSDRMQ
jgi:hypothetical protein